MASGVKSGEVSQSDPFAVRSWWAGAVRAEVPVGGAQDDPKFVL